MKNEIVIPDGEFAAKIHNEILLDLSEVFTGSLSEAKELIKAIAKGKIRNLKIVY